MKRRLRINLTLVRKEILLKRIKNASHKLSKLYFLALELKPFNKEKNSKKSKNQRKNLNKTLHLH